MPPETGGGAVSLATIPALAAGGRPGGAEREGPGERGVGARGRGGGVRGGAAQSPTRSSRLGGTAGFPRRGRSAPPGPGGEGS